MLEKGSRVSACGCLDRACGLFSVCVLCATPVQLDAILASPNGQLSHSSALDERAHIVAEGAGSAAARRKLVLSPANAATTLGVLCEQGWLRALGPELAKFAALSARPLSKKDAAAAAAAAAAASSDSDAVYALGERAYAELRKYIESKAEGKPKCKLCGHPCTMVSKQMAPRANTQMAVARSARRSL